MKLVEHVEPVGVDEGVGDVRRDAVEGVEGFAFLLKGDVGGLQFRSEDGVFDPRVVQAELLVRAAYVVVASFLPDGVHPGDFVAFVGGAAFGDVE